MGDDADGDAAAPVNFGAPAMLAGIAGWTKFDGPGSGCGLDHWRDGAVTWNPDSPDEEEPSR